MTSANLVASDYNRKTAKRDGRVVKKRTAGGKKFEIISHRNADYHVDAAENDYIASLHQRQFVSGPAKLAAAVMSISSQEALADPSQVAKTG